ncbi:MAG: protein-tyrosine phosphatase family protein [Acidimicrobiales bacterium]
MTEELWSTDDPGVIELPSGRRIRGQRLVPDPVGNPPTFAVQLAGRRPSQPAWESVWIPWKDFCLPANPASATRVLRDAHARVETERVEIGCSGGVGRTGTALAAICVLEGMRAEDAVKWVRAHYHPRAVEVPWQRRYLTYVQRSGCPTRT